MYLSLKQYVIEMKIISSAKLDLSSYVVYRSQIAWSFSGFYSCQKIWELNYEMLAPLERVYVDLEGELEDVEKMYMKRKHPPPSSLVDL